MKKNILKQILVVGLVAVVFASCADVPMPYEEPTPVGPTSGSEVLPYSSTNFYTGWSISTREGSNQPWSQGSSYTQATGYQTWGGTSKSNKEVEGILVSPALNLKTDSNAVKFSFDYTIKYTNNVSGWEKYHKIYAAYCNDVTDESKWVEVTGFTPTASPYSDWTLYTSGEIAFPSEFVNKDSVCLIFWFYAPSSASTTWEVMNFLIEEGSAGGSKPTPTGDKSLPYSSANFNTDWTIDVLESSNQPWSQGSTYVQATGYQKWGSDTKSNKEVNGILVSPALSLKTDSSAVKFSFDYTIKYTINVTDWEKYHKIYVAYSTDVADKSKWVEVTDWTPKASTYTDWTLYTSGEMAVPSEFVNKENVCFIFWFYAPASGSTTWELQNFLAQAGKPGGSTPTPTPTPTGDNLIANGDFETWSGSTCTGWQSTTTASSSGAVTKSTDAHAGSYAAQVAGLASQNKRIAYKEITLKPGTYTMSFYAKSTGTKSSVNPGYVAVVDGKVSGSYVYTDYVDVESSWTQVTKSFTLAAQTTVNLVIMNSKNPGVDVLIDDYQLTTTNGGLVDDPTPTPEPTTGIYSINFKTSQGDWTISDKSIGEGITYVWQQTTSYGMKASAYKGSAVAAESWLVSPQIDLSSVTSATLTMSHALNFLNGNNRSDFVKVLISTDQTNWSEVSLDTWPDGASYTYVTSTSSLSSYAGKKIYLAFKYISTASVAPTWEVENLVIK